MVRNLRTLPALLLALAATASPAQGVIRVVVPFAAGGVQDVLARSFNAELGTLLGRSVIVENRTGAGGTIGNASVAKAPPDGHTLLLAAASHTITGSLYAKLPYADPRAPRQAGHRAASAQPRCVQRAAARRLREDGARGEDLRRAHRLMRH